MNSMNKGTCLTILISFFVGTLSLVGQQFVPDFLSNYEWLEVMDVKDWQKQLDLIEEADELIRLSNSKYIEVYNIEKNTELSEKKKAGAIKKLEKEAFELSGESLAKYKVGYHNLYVLTEEYLVGPLKNHPAISEAKSYKKESDLDYASSGEAATLKEQKHLADGNENLLLAIEKNILAISTPADNYLGTEEPQSSNSVTQDFTLDYEVYQKYLDYVNNDLIANPVTMEQLSQIQGGDVSYADFQELWSQYNTGEIALAETSNSEMNEVDSLLQTDQADATIANNPIKELGQDA